MEKTIKVKIEIPIVPTHLRYSIPGEDIRGRTIPLSSFAVEELKKVGEEWTKALIKNAGKHEKTKR